jgi:hypothetical protein
MSKSMANPTLHRHNRLHNILYFTSLGTRIVVTKNQLNIHLRFILGSVDLITKLTKILNGVNLTHEINDLGSLKLNITRGKTLNWGTLNGGPMAFVTQGFSPQLVLQHHV